MSVIVGCWLSGAGKAAKKEEVDSATACVTGCFAGCAAGCTLLPFALSF